MQVALTFDNGPTPGVTDAVLDELGQRGIAATFFVVGEKLRDPARRRLAERAGAEGHAIGNHTLTHTVPLGRADAETARREIDEAQALLGDLAADPPLFRPYGEGGTIDDRLVGRDTLGRLEAGGFTCVLWNCLPRDWLDQAGWVERGLEQVAAIDRAAAGRFAGQPTGSAGDPAAAAVWPVVVLHDVPGAALPRLPELLDRLDDLGATYTRASPDACTPLRAGRPTSSFSLLGLEPSARR